jgi:hypothetical protein
MTVVATVFVYLASGQSVFGITLLRIATLVSMAAVGAVSGKFAGMIWARWRLWRLSAAMECRPRLSVALSPGD